MEEYTFKSRQWIRVALINFCVVALAGITMRYKINFPLPIVDQKYLLHAHSHFAFTGWVTSILITLMVNYLQQENIRTDFKKYHWILLANCITAYGMFFTFIAQGYALYSITFSTLSIFTSYFFIFYFWRDIKKINSEPYARKWFKAALVLWSISSFGAFSLAYLMANHIAVQDYYFAAIYFFLHFQYNGWFVFVCFGLLFSYLHKVGIQPLSAEKKLFNIMLITVGPAYLLSILWLRLPHFLRVIADVSALIEIVILFYFFSLFPLIRKRFTHIKKVTQWLWIMAGVAFVIKILLQLMSLIPFLTDYAFSYRPIVIGYLHLSFLGIISFFIVGYINQLLSETYTQISRAGIFAFVTGVLVQEIILMCQGLEAIEFKPLPHANIILFYAAILIGAGLIWIALSSFRAGKDRISG